MSAFASLETSPFALDVAEGLVSDPKRISQRYLFDDIGLALLNALTLLPEFCIARAEERLHRRYSVELARCTGPFCITANLDPAGNRCPSGWLRLVAELSGDRPKGQPLMLMLPTNSFGAPSRLLFFQFLNQIRKILEPGDYFFFNADLLKDPDTMVAAYNDSTGIVSAFNKNVLGRVNRELLGRFDLRHFDHVVKWNSLDHCVELHLVANQSQEVYIGDLGRRFSFAKGESIRTLTDYKYAESELDELAKNTGFRSLKTWTDIECAFAQFLWTV